MSIKGRVWKYGDDINTDVIFPGKYTYSVSDESEMAKYALEDLDPSFAKDVKAGDIIVAGKNFGCGSSREQAAICLKSAGVGVVVAKSFARIFFRNAINAGLWAITNDKIQNIVEKGDTIEIDLEKGEIIAGDRHLHFPPYPEQVKRIIEAGGLIPYIKSSTRRGK
ncbi:MAG: 3-isopropylmalate dehydratase [candidate division Zixibacteria bacterium 4484_93]|nr:MAG: 3-isopropylmalate dehydratase [candidate division Zixibacteria bacterium 4484_93]RKZ34156.1 MAG: 3-isopropylmalate dehydratase [bacterium]